MEKHKRIDPLESLTEVAKEYARSEDEDVGQSLVWALESMYKSHRCTAVAGLIALNDLHAASNIYWMALNGSDLAQLSAIFVLESTDFSDMTMETPMEISTSHDVSYIRERAVQALEKCLLKATDE